MAKNQTHEHVILELIDSAFRTVKTVPLNLGGLSGTGGGIGQPPGGYIGQLPQVRVSYDETEAESLFTPSSGQSLLDNLNHIRYRINDLEENGASALIVDNWNGVPTITNVDHITFSGAVDVTELSAGHVLVEITASGGSSFTGDTNSVVLTDGAGDLVTTPWLKHGVDSEEYIEFGADAPGKESNAGKMGYESFGAGFFFIIGAGTTTPRKVKIFDDMYVDGDLFANGGQQLVPAKQVTNGDAHDHNGGDGGQINHTSLSSIGTNTHGQIDTHIANTSNPHSVTAAQVAAIPNNGWIAVSATWSRTGNHTYSMSGDTTVDYRKGTKIRYKDGGAFEYGVVALSSFSAGTTIINLTPNSNYAMAAATITDTFISYVENPEGFPHWFDWATTWGNLSGGTVVCKWKAAPKGIHYEISATGSTISGDVTFTPPVTSALSGTRPPVGEIIMLDSGATNYYGVVIQVSSTSFAVRVNSSDNTVSLYVRNVGISGTVPFTWGASDELNIKGFYPF